MKRMKPQRSQSGFRPDERQVGGTPRQLSAISPLEKHFLEPKTSLLFFCVSAKEKQRSGRRVHKSPVEGTLVATSHMWGRSQQQVSDLRGVARQRTEKCFTTGTEKSGETFSMMPHFPLKKNSRGKLSLHSPFPFLVLLKREVHVSRKH